MAMKFTVRKVGDSLGIVLSEEALRTLKVGEGDALYLAEGPEQSPRGIAERPGFEEKKLRAEDLMNRYPNAFRELAK